MNQGYAFGPNWNRKGISLWFSGTTEMLENGIAYAAFGQVLGKKRIGYRAVGSMDIVTMGSR